jgi:hypothetical protein
MEVNDVMLIHAVKCGEVDMPWFLWRTWKIEHCILAFSIPDGYIKIERLVVEIVHSTDWKSSIGSYQIRQEAMTLAQYDIVMYPI